MMALTEMVSITGISVTVTINETFPLQLTDLIYFHKFPFFVSVTVNYHTGFMFLLLMFFRRPAHH